jgi:hypothetical protein
MSTARAFVPNDHGVSAATIDLSGYGSIALAYWAKGTSWGADPELIMHGSTYGANGFGLDFDPATGNLYCFGSAVGSAGSPAAGTWAHLAFCFTGNNGSNPLFNLWVNGTPASNNALSNATSKAFLNALLYLGSYGGSSNFLSGSLAQLGIWGVAGNSQILSSGNVTSLAGGALPGTVQAGSLAHWWKLDGASGANGSESDQVGSVALNFTGTSQDPSGPTLTGPAGMMVPGGLILPSYSTF